VEDVRDESVHDLARNDVTASHLEPRKVTRAQVTVKSRFIEAEKASDFRRGVEGRNFALPTDGDTGVEVRHRKKRAREVTPTTGGTVGAG
jgi:hypothetical protein